MAAGFDTSGPPADTFDRVSFCQMAAEPGSNYEGVIRWLSKAGLSRYVPRFLAEKVTDAEFKLLAEADYKRVGIEAAADKQKLTKLIRSLNPASSRPVSRGAAGTQGATAAPSATPQRAPGSLALAPGCPQTGH